MPLRYLNKQEQQYIPSYTPLEPTHLMKTAENITAQNELALNRWGAFEESHLQALSGANEQQKAAINEMYQGVTRQFQPAIEAGNYRALGYQVPRISKEFAANVMPIREAIGKRQAYTEQLNSAKFMPASVRESLMRQMEEQPIDDFNMPEGIPSEFVGVDKAVAYAKEMAPQVFDTLRVTNPEAYNMLKSRYPNLAEFDFPTALSVLDDKDIVDALLPVLAQDPQLSAQWSFEAQALGVPAENYIQQKATDVARAAAGLKSRSEMVIGQFEEPKLDRSRVGSNFSVLETGLPDLSGVVENRQVSTELNKLNEDRLRVGNMLERFQDQYLTDGITINEDGYLRAPNGEIISMTDPAYKRAYQFLTEIEAEKQPLEARRATIDVALEQIRQQIINENPELGNNVEFDYDTHRFIYPGYIHDGSKGDSPYQQQSDFTPVNISAFPYVDIDEEAGVTRGFQQAGIDKINREYIEQADKVLTELMSTNPRDLTGIALNPNDRENAGWSQLLTQATMGQTGLGIKYIENGRWKDFDPESEKMSAEAQFIPIGYHVGSVANGPSVSGYIVDKNNIIRDVRIEGTLVNSMTDIILGETPQGQALKTLANIGRTITSRLPQVTEGNSATTNLTQRELDNFGLNNYIVNNEHKTLPIIQSVKAERDSDGYKVYVTISGKTDLLGSDRYSLISALQQALTDATDISNQIANTRYVSQSSN